MVIKKSFRWMNWTSLRIFIPAESSFTVHLEITIPADITTGYKIFKVLAISEAWTNGHAQDMGIIKDID